MVSLPQFQPSPPAANCGVCNACCIAPGQPDLGKPFYARCMHLAEVGCGIYEGRPQRCRSYRCAWHLGVLGERVDRRPDQCGVLFQFEFDQGKWYLGMYEIVPNALRRDEIHCLKEVILANEQTRGLSMGNPAVRVYPCGADIPPNYVVSAAYSYHEAPPPPVKFRREAVGHVFVGKVREILDSR